jgi:hypothetical protein
VKPKRKSSSSTGSDIDVPRPVHNSIKADMASGSGPCDEGFLMREAIHAASSSPSTESVPDTPLKKSKQTVGEQHRRPNLPVPPQESREHPSAYPRIPTMNTNVTNTAISALSGLEHVSTISTASTSAPGPSMADITVTKDQSRYSTAGTSAHSKDPYPTTNSIPQGPRQGQGPITGPRIQHRNRVWLRSDNSTNVANPADNPSRAQQPLNPG